MIGNFARVIKPGRKKVQFFQTTGCFYQRVCYNIGEPRWKWWALLSTHPDGFDKLANLLNTLYIQPIATPDTEPRTSSDPNL